MAAAAAAPAFNYGGMYRTDDEAYDALAQAQNTLGYPLSKKRSKANPKTGVKNRIDVRCHKSGTYRPWKHNANQYQTSSRKSDCPFYVIIRFDKNTTGFFLEVVSEEHNHDPVENPLDSCRSRRQSQMHFGIPRLEKLVESRSRIPGLTAKDIAEQIVNEYPEVSISRHDVLCMQNKIRRSRTGAFATIQTFLDSLGDSDRVFYYAADKGPDDKLLRIFWIYHHNIEDWRRSPEVLLFDNTYKINHLKMPLLQVTGTTALQTSFSAGFGLVAKEDVASFTWILKQLKIAATKARVPLPMVVMTDFDDACLKKASADVFDTSEQQVCMWHIMKDITLNIQQKWTGSMEGSIMSHRVPTPIPTPQSTGAPPYHQIGEDLLNTPLELEIDQATERAIQISWQALQAPPPPDVPPGGPRKFSDTADGIRDAWVEVCRAESDAEFWQRWAQLCYEFPMQKDIITFLHDIYVPERQQFVQYSVKWFQNYGTRMISRIKNSHLKDFFDNGSTDLCQLEQHIWEMVSSYRETYELRLQQELGRRQAHWDEYSVIKDVELSVGSKTMDAILQQVRFALDELQGKIPPLPCTGQFKKQMGLPCRHHILSLIEKSETLAPEHIDRHWLLKPSDQNNEASTDQQNGEFKLVQLSGAPSLQHSSISRVQYPSATRVQQSPAPNLQQYHIAPSTESSALRTVQPPIVSRTTGARVPHPAHKADGRVPIPIQPRSDEQTGQPVQGRRRIQRRKDQPAQSVRIQNQIATDTRRAVGTGTRTIRTNPDNVSKPQPPSVNAPGGVRGRAPRRPAAVNTHHQPNQDARATQLSLAQNQSHGQQVMGQSQQPSMPSYAQHPPLASQVVSNTLVQNAVPPENYQQFAGMGNLNLYNLGGGVPQQTTQGTFNNQNLQYTFRIWQPRPE
ncbi:PKS-NRPS hybrid synthetase cheA-like protein [Cladobotryum mycophilum]|uniref:PKS-NRPS hybrid synthetase cheA-like protein n=1 Tax=Cladobotryum mycophilum TaxID=491253 RepID=A0ABR0SVT5_9HYPO